MTGMKLLTEYLERAVSLERLAAGEQDSMFKDELLSQAAAYRKLAAKRANDYGLPPPSPPENSRGKLGSRSPAMKPEKRVIQTIEGSGPFGALRQDK